MREPKFFDNFIRYRNGILAQNGLISHTNVVGNLTKPIFLIFSTGIGKKY